MMGDMADPVTPAGPVDPAGPEDVDLDATLRGLSRWDGVSPLSEDDEPLTDIVAATERGFQVVTGEPYDPAELIRRTPGLAAQIARELAEPRPRWGWRPRRPR